MDPLNVPYFDDAMVRTLGNVPYIGDVAREGRRMAELRFNQALRDTAQSLYRQPGLPLGYDTKKYKAKVQKKYLKKTGTKMPKDLLYRKLAKKGVPKYLAKYKAIKKFRKGAKKEADRRRKSNYINELEMGDFPHPHGRRVNRVTELVNKAEAKEEAAEAADRKRAIRILKLRGDELSEENINVVLRSLLEKSLGPSVELTGIKNTSWRDPVDLDTYAKPHKARASLEPLVPPIPSGSKPRRLPQIDVADLELTLPQLATKYPNIPGSKEESKKNSDYRDKVRKAQKKLKKGMYAGIPEVEALSKGKETASLDEAMEKVDETHEELQEAVAAHEAAEEELMEEAGEQPSPEHKEAMASEGSGITARGITARGITGRGSEVVMGRPAGGGYASGGFVGATALITAAAPLIIEGVMKIGKKIAGRIKANKAARRALAEKAVTSVNLPPGMNPEASSGGSFWRKAYKVARHNLPMYLGTSQPTMSAIKSFLRNHQSVLFGAPLKSISTPASGGALRRADVLAPFLRKVEPMIARAILSHRALSKPAGAGVLDSILKVVKSPEVQEIGKKAAKAFLPKIAAKLKALLKRGVAKFGKKHKKAAAVLNKGLDIGADVVEKLATGPAAGEDEDAVTSFIRGKLGKVGDKINAQIPGATDMISDAAKYGAETAREIAKSSSVASKVAEGVPVEKAIETAATSGEGYRRVYGGGMNTADSRSREGFRAYRVVELAKKT